MKTKKLLITLIALVTLVGLTAADLPPRPEPAPPPALAELSLVIFADRSQAQVGDTVNFTIIVYNPSIKVRGTSVLGLIPKELEVVGVSATQGSANFKPASNIVNVSIGAIQYAETVTITVKTKVIKQAEVGTKYYTSAKINYKNHFLSTQFFSNWLAVTITE